MKEDNQYGKQVQSVALALMNEGMVSMNRTKSIISGLTHNEINLSEGYISKLQKIISLPVLHWDDTVIMISTNRVSLRFYGNYRIAYYSSHMHKDKKGFDVIK